MFRHDDDDNDRGSFMMMRLTWEIVAAGSAMYCCLVSA